MAKVTVAVVSCDQAGLLREFLERHRRFCPNEGIDLLVVDDGSSDTTPDILAACRLPGFRWHRQEHWGIAKARNHALRLTESDWVAFTDTDCIASGNWYETLTRIPERYPDALAVEGAVRGLPSGKTFFVHRMENLEGGMYATANLVVRREAALAAGGFEGAFGNYREDVDLALRLRRQGFIPFEPRLEVMHPTLKLAPAARLAGSWKRCGRILNSELLLAARHPAAYGTVRAHATVAGTLRAWCLRSTAAALRRSFQARDRLRKEPGDALCEILNAFLEQAAFLGQLFRSFGSAQGRKLLQAAFFPRMPQPFLEHGRALPQESGRRPRALVVWTGAVTPAYRDFLQRLGERVDLLVLTPVAWKHGGVVHRFAFPRGESPSYLLRPVAFRPSGSARYLVPSLFLHLQLWRPSHLFWMDEWDRLTVALQIAAARILRPRIKVALYGLQNIPRPTYHGWAHRLAMLCNRFQIHSMLAATGEAADCLRRQGFGGRIRLAPLGLSPRRFRRPTPTERAALRDKYGIPTKATVICFTGSISEAKGLDILAGALAGLDEETRPWLLVAGRGPLEKELPSLLPSRLRLLGARPTDRLPDVYRMSDYVILPSRSLPNWEEQVGRSLIEGILCGCLALGSDSGHIPHLVTAPEATFKQGDSASLEALLHRLPLFGEENLRNRQYARVMESYTDESMANAFTASIEEDSR